MPAPLHLSTACLIYADGLQSATAARFQDSSGRNGIDFPICRFTSSEESAKMDWIPDLPFCTALLVGKMELAHNFEVLYADVYFVYALYLLMG